MTTLNNKHILVVEDEYLIASDLARALRDAGAEVIGPVGDLKTALMLAAERPLDAALLDVNLDGAMSFPVAEALDEAGVPHLFLTGYDGWSLPERYRDQLRIAKPFIMERVVSAVENLCASEAGT